MSLRTVSSCTGCNALLLPGRSPVQCLNYAFQFIRLVEDNFQCRRSIPCLWDKSMDEGTTKTPNRRRLYWCLIKFIDRRHSQSCWYFRPLLWTVAPLPSLSLSSVAESSASDHQSRKAPHHSLTYISTYYCPHLTFCIPWRGALVG